MEKEQNSAEKNNGTSQFLAKHGKLANIDMVNSKQSTLSIGLPDFWTISRYQKKVSSLHTSTQPTKHGWSEAATTPGRSDW